MVEHLTKRFGSGVTAVADLSFSAAPGKVTGFLGPNGAGKTTTLRCLLGLVAQTEGKATIDGVTYREIENPITVVGASLEASGAHPARTARNHLRMIASAAKITDTRVSEVLETVGLTAAADRKVGGYSGTRKFSFSMNRQMALTQKESRGFEPFFATKRAKASAYLFPLTSFPRFSRPSMT